MKLFTDKVEVSGKLWLGHFGTSRSLRRTGARGPIAESRLSRRDDGKYSHETKKGITLLLTSEQLVRRLLWQIPPARLHLTSFHGLFSSHAAARATVMPSAAPAQEPAVARAAAKAKREKRPILDWATLHAKTWGVDVWTCHCGGKRKVMALVTSRRTAEEIRTQPRPAPALGPSPHRARPGATPTRAPDGVAPQGFPGDLLASSPLRPARCVAPEISFLALTVPRSQRSSRGPPPAHPFRFPLRLPSPSQFMA